jgi:antitoxin CptB
MRPAAPAADHDDRARRARAIWRAGHRGIREMDLLLGPFAAAHVGAMDEMRLARFEALLAEPDPDLLSWMTGETPPPERWRDGLLGDIVRFARSHAGNGGA